MTPDVERFYRAVLEHVDDAVVTTSFDARVTYANPAAATMFGISEADALGKSLLELLAGARWPPGTDGVRGVVELLAERGSWRGEVGFTTPDGRDLVVDMSTSYLRDVDGAIAGSVTVSRDITRRKELEAALLRSATHDPLTDLLNRSAFTAVVEEVLATGEDIAVAFVDLNGFKGINDTWGHESGDEVLMTVAASLRRSIRVTDRAGRFGGDEFVVLLRDVHDDDAALQLVDRFASEVQRPIRARRGHTHRVGAAIGIARRRHDDTVDTLLRRADAAMYQAKRSSNVRAAAR